MLSVVSSNFHNDTGFCPELMSMAISESSNVRFLFSLKDEIDELEELEELERRQQTKLERKNKLEKEAKLKAAVPAISNSDTEKIQLLEEENARLKAGKKKRYVAKEKPEYKYFKEINPNLFSEILAGDISEYATRLEKDFYPYIDSRLEKEIYKFIFECMLPNGLSIAKISQSELVHGRFDEEGNEEIHPTSYSPKSVRRGINLSKERKTFFTHCFRNGDNCWFFLNTTENKKLIKDIKSGKIKETDLFKLKTEATLKRPTPTVKMTEDLGQKDCTPQSKCPSTSVMPNPESIEDRTSLKTESQKNNSPSNNIYSNKEYIYSNNSEKNPNGIFSENEMREFLINYSPSWQLSISDLNSLIEEFKIPKVYDAAKELHIFYLSGKLYKNKTAAHKFLLLKLSGVKKGKTKVVKTEKNKYLSLVHIFLPDHKDKSITMKQAAEILRDEVKNIYQLAALNQSKERAEQLLSKIYKLNESCDLKVDLEWPAIDEDSNLKEIIDEMKELIAKK